jgi:hypothetical protein
MNVWTITVHSTFSDRIGIQAETEAEAREQALDLFEQLYNVTDQENEQFYWDKLEIVKVEEGKFLN